MRKILLISILGELLISVRLESAAPRTADLKEYPDPSGTSRSFSANGALDLRNPFFQNLGSNGRACISCHQPDQGWTITPAGIQQRFDATGGLDPIFRHQ